MTKEEYQMGILFKQAREKRAKKENRPEENAT